MVDDVYKRFLKPNATDAHYVAVGRAVTVALTLLACLVVTRRLLVGFLPR